MSPQQVRLSYMSFLYVTVGVGLVSGALLAVVWRFPGLSTHLLIFGACMVWPIGILGALPATSPGLLLLTVVLGYLSIYVEVILRGRPSYRAKP